MTINAAALAGRALGRRETQILELLAEGRGWAAIAAELYVSVGTAKKFGAILHAKIGAHTAAQAVAIGYQRGYLAVSAELAEDLAVIHAARELGYRLAVVATGEREDG